MHHRSQAKRRSAKPFGLIALVVLALGTGPTVSADEPPASVRNFVQDYCAKCHNAENKGRLDLANLTFEPKDSANLAIWIKMHDRVEAGEMPPKSRPRPEAGRQKRFVESLTQ